MTSVKNTELQWGFMMSEQVKQIIRQTVLEILDNSVSQENIQNLTKKHQNKIHFIPVRYRVLGGILQGLNIKFGNFIEQLLRNIAEIDPNVEVMKDSGKKIKLFFTPETDSLIDRYITERQLSDSPDDCTIPFSNLLNNILEIEKTAIPRQRKGITKDVDGLFRTSSGVIVYTELKYNDDHDTGKFVDINRKFIKTWAGLAVRYKIRSKDELLPILYYFNPRKRYAPIYVPRENIMRGAQLFERFLQVRYADVDKYLSEISDDPAIIAKFDEMYRSVMSM